MILSQQSRINGGTFRSKVVRGRERQYTLMTGSENDNSSWVNTQLDTFNSRQNVTQFDAIKMPRGPGIG